MKHLDMVESTSSDTAYDSDVDEKLSNDSESIYEAFTSEPPSKKMRMAPKESVKLDIERLISNLEEVCPRLTTVFEVRNAPVITVENSLKEPLTFPLYNTPAYGVVIKYFRKDEFEENRTASSKFEIRNPKWMPFVENHVVPYVKRVMGVDTDLVTKLSELVILQAGSSFQLPSQPEEHFAKLVIQLPSIYKGGVHSIQHRDFVKQVDFNARIKGNPGQSVGFLAFHRDCSHKIDRITEGVAVYLTYDLILKSGNIPRAPTVADSENEAKLMSLLSSWEDDPKKLVVCLRGDYKTKDVSTKNIKSADRSTAIRLARWAHTCSFEIFCGELWKKVHGEVSNRADPFNAHHPHDVLDVEFAMKDVKGTIGSETVSFRHLNVNFSEDVVPETCFDDVKPVRGTRKRIQPIELEYPPPVGDLGYHAYTYYRRPAFLLVKQLYLVNALKESNADNTEIIKLYIALHKKYATTLDNPIIHDAFVHMARKVVKIEMGKAVYLLSGDKLHEDLLKCFDELKDKELMQIYFEKNQLTAENLPIFVAQCDRFGWMEFTASVSKMIGNIDHFQRVKRIFEMLLIDGVEHGDKRKALNAILKSILASFQKQPEWFVREKALKDLKRWALDINFDAFEFEKALLK